eukprot:TRINITY_DN1910_c0_g1_i5.p1 TRINITY_DN1910_c0_g1~~TRINITY_DN1910_c0_g1_i5.p1  ORF type:complete len:321 (+),score=58.19 TRINITY_DN1910_c0_g1_i5:158-1120(+)
MKMFLVILSLLAVGVLAQVEDFSFNELKSCVPFTVKVGTGDKYAVELIGDEAVLPAISAEIETQAGSGWRILNIQTVDAINTQKTLAVQVTLPLDDALLRKVTLSGAGDIELELKQTRNDFEAENKGSGNLVLRAGSKVVRLINSGSGNITASGAYQEATLTSSGKGDIYLQGAISVEVAASGDGTIFIDGVAGFTQITGEHTGAGVVFSRGATCEVGPFDVPTEDFQANDPGAPVVAVARQVAVAQPGQSVSGRQTSVGTNRGTTVTTAGNASSNQCVPAQGPFPTTVAALTCGLVTTQAAQCGGEFVTADAVPCEDEI